MQLNSGTLPSQHRVCSCWHPFCNLKKSQFHFSSPRAQFLSCQILQLPKYIIIFKSMLVNQWISLNSLTQQITAKVDGNYENGINTRINVEPAVRNKTMESNRRPHAISCYKTQFTKYSQTARMTCPSRVSEHRVEQIVNKRQRDNRKEMGGSYQKRVPQEALSSSFSRHTIQISEISPLMQDKFVVRPQRKINYASLPLPSLTLIVIYLTVLKLLIYVL